MQFSSRSARQRGQATPMTRSRASSCCGPMPRRKHQSLISSSVMREPMPELCMAWASLMASTRSARSAALWRLKRAPGFVVCPRLARPMRAPVCGLGYDGCRSRLVAARVQAIRQNAGVVLAKPARPSSFTADEIAAHQHAPLPDAVL